MFEIPPQEIFETAVIEALRKNPELMRCEVYLRWMEQEEKRVFSEEDGLNLILKDAKIREEAGLREAARMAYEDALEQASQMGKEERVEEIRKKIADLQ